ncbi:TIM barrel protein [Sphingomonas sp. RB3P16]|uniref:sugar phosphate isomerase/epimerase family protein n=1 Tax=Parasphingomonas frigoris TaxID=3096163 RepID=UPI002FC5BCC6
MSTEQPVVTTTTAPGQNIKWSYMDHWTMRSPSGWVTPQHGVQYADRFYKQLAGIGFQGVDPFEFRLLAQSELFGSAKKAEEFARDRGIERFVNMFVAFYDDRTHLAETHDALLKNFENKVRMYDGITLDSYIVMPVSRYWLVEPVTDDKIKTMAEGWNRVGKMLKSHGIKLSCHHEFYCALHSKEEIDTFYAHADPEYVGLFIDTAQHEIVGIDSTDLYLQYADRVTGFHFKDTHHVDTVDDYKTPPDPERAASTTDRWFWEMGTAEGLVDFPKLMQALKDKNYTGWLTVEHDKADIGGANYAESTARSKWYIDNVLSPIYS